MLYFLDYFAPSNRLRTIHYPSIINRPRTKLIDTEFKVLVPNLQNTIYTMGYPTARMSKMKPPARYSCRTETASPNSSQPCGSNALDDPFALILMLNLKKCPFPMSSYLLLLQNTNGWAAGRSLLLWVWHAGENNIQWQSIAHAPKSVNEINCTLV